LHKGRPPILDDEAKLAISRNTASHGDLGKMELRQLISEMHKNTWLRAQQKYSIYHGKDYKMISRRSMERYLKIFAKAPGPDVTNSENLAFRES
jgi:hypothetical protein